MKMGEACNGQQKGRFAVTGCRKSFFPGWSKTFRCKAREIMRNEAYFAVRCNDEG
jgi:hypothetical protein